MGKHKVFFSALMFCFAGLACYGQEPQIQAKITPALTEVRNNEAFLVSVVILNAGREDQVLRFSTCGEGIEWGTDNPLVRPHGGGSCKKPGILRIGLKPGGEYARKFSAHIELADDKTPHESVTFRLELFYEGHGAAAKVVQIWSNAVTVNVQR